MGSSRHVRCAAARAACRRDLCAAPAPDATAILALTGRVEDISAWRAELRAAGTGDWPVEAEATSGNGYGFVRMRVPANLSFRDYGAATFLAGRHRLTVAPPQLDAPLCPFDERDPEPGGDPGAAR